MIILKPPEFRSLWGRGNRFSRSLGSQEPIFEVSGVAGANFRSLQGRQCRWGRFLGSSVASAFKIWGARQLLYSFCFLRTATATPVGASNHEDTTLAMQNFRPPEVPARIELDQLVK